MLLIQKHLEDIFIDLLHTHDDSGVVNMRIATIKPIDGGVTRPGPNMTGSEFCKFPTDKDGHPLGAFTATGYAKLAAHEAMHNVSGLDNNRRHPQGGVGGSPPHLLVNDANRKAFQAGLGNIPKQLLGRADFWFRSKTGASVPRKAEIKKRAPHCQKWGF